MILVVGATGLLGAKITRRLLQQSKPVRILTRAGSPAAELSAAGAQAVTGDLKDRPSLDAAVAGVDAVVTTANSILRGGADTVESVDRDGNRNLIEAAAGAGVRHFVFTSLLGADAGSPVPFMRAKGESEALLRTSGMAWTVLAPNLFMDVWIPMVVGAPAMAGDPVTVVGGGNRQHSLVAAEDVAAYAVAAIERREAEGQTLIIGGPEAVSYRDIAATFERQLGRPVPVQTVAAREPVPGLPAAMSPLLAFQDTYDSPIDMTELAAVYGVAPTSVEDFVRGFLAAQSPAG